MNSIRLGSAAEKHGLSEYPFECLSVSHMDKMQQEQGNLCEIFMADYKSKNWCKINQIMLILHSLQLVHFPATPLLFLHQQQHVQVQQLVPPAPHRLPERSAMSVSDASHDLNTLSVVCGAFGLSGGSCPGFWFKLCSSSSSADKTLAVGHGHSFAVTTAKYFPPAPLATITLESLSD